MTQVEYRKLDSRLYNIESTQESIQEMLLEYVGEREDQRQQSFEFSNENLSELKSLSNKIFSLGEPPEDEPEIDYEQIAKTAHEAAHAVISFLGGESKAWEDIPQETKQKAVDSAYNIYYDDVTPQKLHEEFLRFFKDADKVKEKYPERLATYDELPDREKIRYILYITVVKSFRK